MHNNQTENTDIWGLIVCNAGFPFPFSLYCCPVLSFTETFPAFGVKVSPAPMEDFHSFHSFIPPLLPTPPPLPTRLCLPQLPDPGVRSSPVVSDRVMSHGSILETCLINLLPYRVTEHTNFGAAENPLAVLINRGTCMNARTASVHNDKQTSHRHVLARANATVMLTITISYFNK